MRRTWIRALEAGLSGLLVGLLAASPALAQQPALRLLPRVLPSAAAPKLLVLVVPLDAPAQAEVPRLTWLAEKTVAGSDRFAPVPLAEALDAQGVQEREEKAQEAAAALKEGLKAYDELDTQKALKQFDKAAQTYEGSDLTRHFADMTRAKVMKIASYVANGDNKGFLKELREMLPRNPNAEFSSNYFPADELATIEKLRKSILNEANRSLEVKTGDVVARVFVDGEFRGFTPKTLSGLTSAEHFVTVIAPGYGQAQGKARGEVSFTLEPVPASKQLKVLVDRIAKDPDGLDRDAALREVGTLTGAQQVVALMVRGAPGATAQDAIGVRVDVADGHNLAYATVPVPGTGEAMDSAMLALLTSVLQSDAARAKGKPVHIPAVQTSSGRKTAGYVLIGTGAALVVGGLIFGLQASTKSSDFKNAVQNSPTAEKLRSDGKTFALLADIGVIGGLVAAGTGSWLAFAGGDSGGKAAAKPSRSATPAARAPPPSREPASTPAPASTREPTPAARPAEKPAEKPAPPPAPAPTPAPAPQSKPAANAREEEKRKREEEAQLKREEEERRKQEEERLKREEEEKKKREEAAKREQEERKKREQEEKKKREEEEKKKKKPALDEDDLRNY
ncbi:PEGA domain-containing protein [Hyalangium versicolor]|uniref:PEGA domain-containing protein n=1 Tax=Hyalangium versicolor TaxID=2861190 RepID=UPI001CCF5CEF|nr:PEGA domain-containing protein [Hyalangium versicolor]